MQCTRAHRWVGPRRTLCVEERDPFWNPSTRARSNLATPLTVLKHLAYYRCLRTIRSTNWLTCLLTYFISHMDRSTNMLYRGQWGPGAKPLKDKGLNYCINFDVSCLCLSRLLPTFRMKKLICRHKSGGLGQKLAGGAVLPSSSSPTYILSSADVSSDRWWPYTTLSSVMCNYWRSERCQSWWH